MTDPAYIAAGGEDTEIQRDRFCFLDLLLDVAFI